MFAPIWCNSPATPVTMAWRSGADGRDALVVAERVLAAIQAHLWGERANRTTAPDAPLPVLRGPHWPMLNQPLRGRRQAS